jgi:hypothetical protein
MLSLFLAKTIFFIYTYYFTALFAPKSKSEIIYQRQSQIQKQLRQSYIKIIKAYLLELIQCGVHNNSIL